MNKIKNENMLSLETIITVFTVEKGQLKILLEKKKEDPYKGYWSLPTKILLRNETIEESIDDILEEKLGVSNIFKEQDYTFSNINRNPSDRVIGTSYICLIDVKTMEIKKEQGSNEEKDWFRIEEIPKTAYDHIDVINHAIEKLKTKLNNVNVLKNLFPSDFTLPELQNIYESILNIKLDRRNFRKKIMNLDIIEDTGYKNIGGSGRPAKLYKFKENIKEINLF